MGKSNCIEIWGLRYGGWFVYVFSVSIGYPINVKVNDVDNFEPACGGINNCYAL